MDSHALHPQVRALLAAEERQGAPADLAAERAAYRDVARRLGGPAEPVADMVELVVPSADPGGIPAALYVPQREPETIALIVWLHGGGWYLGDIPAFDRVARSLANAAGQRVLLVDYRLAPEHRFPQQVHDADATVRWARSSAGARQLGIDAARVIVGGDSAGGQLAAVAARHTRHDGLPPLAAQLLVYPTLDPTLDSDAYREFAAGPSVTAAGMARCWDRYRAGHDIHDPDLAVLRARDHESLPPTWIALAGQDPIRDDGRRYATALRAAGIDVTERIFDDMAHGFLRWDGVVDRTRELLQWLGAAARTSVS